MSGTDEIFPNPGAPGERRAAAPAPATTGISDDMLGKRVGFYELKRVLGRGGMGTVYFAEHQIIKSHVAVKILHPRYCSDETIVKRFFTEARVVNLIGHENIVKIYDFNVTPDGRYYFVMEYLEGATLTQYIGGPTRLSEVAPVIRQVMDALECAHGQGVTHRDLKPDNILLAPVGNRLVAKVLDFGIAKLNVSEVDVHTSTGAILGTPHYMAPEQVLGERVDSRADVYSLGVILFWIATGRVPFDSNVLPKLLYEHAYRPPPLPSDVNPDLGLSYNEVIQRALAKTPAERYQTIAELRADFERAVSDALSYTPPAPAAPPPRLPPEIPDNPPRFDETFDEVKIRPTTVRRESRQRTELEVRVRIGDMDNFRRMYSLDISHHGMFIATEEKLPPVGTIIDVVIHTRDYPIDLQLVARVVRLVTPADAVVFGGRPGMAIQLLDLDANRRQQFERLMEGLPTIDEPRPRATDPNPKAHAMIERFRNQTSRNPYMFLSVLPVVDASTIREAVRRLRRELDPEVMGMVTDEQAQSLGRIREELAKVSGMLLDPASRAAYDAVSGNFIGVAQALAAGLDLDELKALRTQFLSTRRDATQVARVHVREAMVAEYAGRLNEARIKFEAALALDPLDLETHNRYWALRHRMEHEHHPTG